MNDIMYLVAWTGGYEAPSYFASPFREVAIAKAVEWAADADFENGDSMDILRITDTIDGMIVERLEDFTPEEQNLFDELGEETRKEVFWV